MLLRYHWLPSSITHLLSLCFCLLCLAALVQAADDDSNNNHNNGISHQQHSGSQIPNEMLWDECYIRHRLSEKDRNINDVDHFMITWCAEVDCAAVDLDRGDQEYQACLQIQSDIHSQIKQNQKGTSPNYNSNSFYRYQISESLKNFYTDSFQRIFNNNDDRTNSIQNINGLKFIKVQDKDIQVIQPRASLIDGNNGGSSSNSTEISDWEPVNDIIGQNQTKFYQFNVNMTSTGLSSFYHILIFLSGNICTLPKSIGSNDQLLVQYGFDLQLVTNISNATYSNATFANGYMKGLAKHSIPTNPNDTFVTLYTKVTAPPTNNVTDYWNYQFGISQKDLVYQWDNKTWISFVDSDETSALFATGNFTQANTMKIPDSNSSSDIKYEVYLYPYNADKDYFQGLSNSWCAIRNGPSLINSATGMDVSYTNRSNALRQQFYVQSLNTSTRYIGYALQTNKQGNLGGTVFKPFEFLTKENDACQLIYDLEFCENVAYSVPAKPLLNISSSLSLLATDKNNTKFLLKSLYDNHTSELYDNFAKALDQIACETEPDARYSPIRTCHDCANSYKNWLCAVTIPRCTTTNRTEYPARNNSNSRSPFINQQISPNPYFEILPCYNSCHAIVRDCPAQFGFACPVNDLMMSKTSYFWDLLKDYMTCNYVGSTLLESASRGLQDLRYGVSKIGVVVVVLLMFVV